MLVLAATAHHSSSPTILLPHPRRQSFHISHTIHTQKPLSFAIATQLPPHKAPACTSTLPKHRQPYAFPQSFLELGTASATKEARGGGATDCSPTETVDLQHDGGHATATATTAAAAPPPSLATVPPQPGAPPSTGAADVRPFFSRSRGYEPRQFRSRQARRGGHVPLRFAQVSPEANLGLVRPRVSGRALPSALPPGHATHGLGAERLHRS